MKLPRGRDKLIAPGIRLQHGSRLGSSPVIICGFGLSRNSWLGRMIASRAMTRPTAATCSNMWLWKAHLVTYRPRGAAVLPPGVCAAGSVFALRSERRSLPGLTRHPWHRAPTKNRGDVLVAIHHGCAGQARARRRGEDPV